MSDFMSPSKEPRVYLKAIRKDGREVSRKEKSPDLPGSWGCVGMGGRAGQPYPPGFGLKKGRLGWDSSYNIDPSGDIIVIFLNYLESI
jgi:hypothetical protein